MIKTLEGAIPLETAGVGEAKASGYVALRTLNTVCALKPIPSVCFLEP